VQKNKDIFLNQLNDNQFIEVFRLEDLDDTSIFENYQRYDFYQLIWFVKAGGDPTYFLDFNEYTIKDNQAVMIFPGQIDRLDTHGKEGYLFAIQNDVLFRINQRLNSDYLNGYLSNVFISPDNDTKIILEQITRLILLEYNSQKRNMLIESYVEAFLFHISSLSETTAAFDRQPDTLISELMRLIDKNFITYKENDFYAEKLGISIKGLNDACKKGTGKTVKQHIQEKLVLEIKREIRLKKKSLKEIAFDLGFSEPAYFTRFFKQQTSLTPTEFRSRLEDLSK